MLRGDANSSWRIQIKPRSPISPSGGRYCLIGQQPDLKWIYDCMLLDHVRQHHS